MDNKRTDTARTHDDHTLIDDIVETPDTGGRSGGNLQRDVGTQDELAHVDNPDAHTRVTKEDDMAHGDRTPASHHRG